MVYGTKCNMVSYHDYSYCPDFDFYRAIAKAQEYKVAKGVSEKEVGSLKPLICESRGRPREEENVEKPSTQQVTITIQDKSKSSYSLSKVHIYKVQSFVW